MKTNSLMVDIETLGFTESSIILSMAAIVFDPKTETSATHIEYQSFVRYFNIEEQKGARTTNHDTLEWWKKQDEDVIQKNFGGKTSLKEGLTEFHDFIMEHEIDLFWAKGTHFDFPILRHAMLENDVRCMFEEKFWNVTDMRTIGTSMNILLDNSWAYQNLIKSYFKKINLPAHDPLGDVIVQAKTVEKFFSSLL